MGRTLEIQIRNPRTPLEKEIAELGPWFHNLHLPDGTQTAPGHKLGDFPRFKWQQIAPHLPEDLSGWKALDIGCNAGFYSFELARRGAEVTGMDVDRHYLRQAKWAAKKLRLEERTVFKQMSVYDLAVMDEKYDLIFFMGVFYHLRYPLLALDTVASKVRQLMVFQTVTMPGEQAEDTPADLALDQRDRLAAEGWPKMAFIERSFSGDPSSWWAPNHACVLAMLRSAGLRSIMRVAYEVYVCKA